MDAADTEFDIQEHAEILAAKAIEGFCQAIYFDGQYWGQVFESYELVYDIIEKHVADVNRSLAEDSVMAGSQIKRFLILHKELDADDGELTRTRKVRRGVINEKYGDIIEGIYTGRPQIDVDTIITFQDGTKQRIRTQLKAITLASAKDARLALPMPPSA